MPDFRIWVRFSDATEGAVDPREFARLTVQSDTVVWANGFDLAPEYLYANRSKQAVA